MEFYEVVCKRRTCREWEKREVDFEVIKRIIKTGLKAPTHNHLREWEFIILHDAAEIKAVLEYAKEWTDLHGSTDFEQFPDKSVQRQMYEYAMPRQYSMLANAPYVIIPVFKAQKLNSTAVNHLNALSSVWCVVENIFLAVTAENLGYSMRIPVGEEGAAVCRALNVPNGYMMPCYIGIGYPAKDAPEIEQIAVSVDEKLHFGKWQGRLNL